tara:strand:+ start:1208 stop:1375 length:168 start_codon:yes stop_codon:yes gene_type:complete
MKPKTKARPVKLKTGTRTATFTSVAAAKKWADRFVKKNTKFTITFRGTTSSYQRT